MEDTKKLIEKYKRELMELSRTAKRDEPAPARAPQIIGYVDNMDEKTFNEAAMNVASEKRDTCGDKAQQPEERALSAPEPRVESEPELPYHHEPEVPPPDYSDQEYVEPIPMPTPEPRTESVPMPAPEPRAESIPMPTPSVRLPETTVSPESASPQTEPDGEAPSASPRTETAPSEAPTEKYEPPYLDPQMAQNAGDSARYPDLEQNGSQSQPPNFPEPQYTSFEDFRSKNSGRGTMVFRITTAREALPVEGAKCVITKKFGGIIYEIDTLFTDRSGQTAPRTLPAPPKSLSQQYDNLVQPFALYDATVTRDGYVDVVLTDIPVFDGVQSVQRVSMLPTLSDSVFENISEVNPNAR